MVKGNIQFPEINTPVHDLRILIVSTLWNPEIISSLVKGTVDAILETGVKESQISFVTVPGSWELVAGVQLNLKEYDVVVPIGCLIKGSTMHFEYISESVARGLMDLSLKSGIPILYGVLNCLTLDQARERAGLVKDSHNHGKDWGSGAVRMGLMYKSSRNLQ